MLVTSEGTLKEMNGQEVHGRVEQQGVQREGHLLAICTKGASNCTRAFKATVYPKGRTFAAKSPSQAASHDARQSCYAAFSRTGAKNKQHERSPWDY